MKFNLLDKIHEFTRVYQGLCSNPESLERLTIGYLGAHSETRGELRTKYQSASSISDPQRRTSELSSLHGELKRYIGYDLGRLICEQNPDLVMGLDQIANGVGDFGNNFKAEFYASLGTRFLDIGACITF